MPQIINKFNIFRDFPSNLRQNIKSFYASRDDFDRDFGYCVLNDNKVFGFGERIHHNLCCNKSNEKYFLINELCGKNIQQFYHGYGFMFAGNDNNEIFSWGWNHWGKLARGFKSYEYLKPEKISFFDGKNIIEISCGFDHCLALSSDGVVYGWGNNYNGQVGCGERENDLILSPIKNLEINLKEKIKFIHCARNNSFAVSFDGNAYYWGEIDTSSRDNFIPKLISLKNVSKVYYFDYRDIIILNNYGNVFEFNALNQEINEIKSLKKFIDLYKNKNNECVLQSEDCVYQIVYYKSEYKLNKTKFFNFFDFNSQKEDNFYKTIEISKDGYLMTKEIQFNERLKKNILVQKNYIFDTNNFKEITPIGEGVSDSVDNGIKNEINQIEIIEKNYQNIFDKKYENMFEEIMKIGEGGFGTVLKVKKKSNQTHYAIKIIEIKDESNLNEIKIMSEFNTEFIVQYIDSWIEEKIFSRTTTKLYLYIQMELCSMNLRDFIGLMHEINYEKFKIFSYYFSCELLREVIECVNYFHSKSIIHRDLKPENILISEGLNGRFLKLCDFGLSIIHDKSSHTRDVGTRNYMAPEVMKSRNYNTKSDVYSLALIATEIFKFEDKVETIRNHKTREEFNKYCSKYSELNLETTFRKILDMISNCLLPEDYNSRPDCKQLLEKINECYIDKSLVLNDKNSQFLLNIWKGLSKFGQRFFA